ncbi:hypothetical protein Rumeso_00782 [Rubellimicrobium mesophilum DSM 19309]|uniref:Twin-arginine translocation pathway signal n=1 Tax=Rubellimicrobium mesophilum DSM 19309 TaxID=442562 RepID=A0A017HTB3_9RHOB|nr:DUF1501 domain-containing protein [Rubellimicrobium mesophilum]EYD77616.1 hypothetical protein Rumeso_00782 [Rubellimicrobium mesophilum DSM 19309]
MAILLDRRRFLGGLAVGCSAAASPLMTPVVFASAPWEQRLVVLILRGAMDGLDVVRPVGDPAYRAMRPTLAQGGLPLDGWWELHPALEPLLPLWEAGEMGAVHAVSTPYRDRRSHFDGQDILEAGTGEEGLAGAKDGWLNRMLQAVPGIEAQTAYAIGREELKILVGAAPVSSWSPDARLELSPQARRLLEVLYHDDPLFRAASAEALGIVDELHREGQSGGGELAGHVQLAQFAAARLRGETRIASFSLGGWDTHGDQRRTLARALRTLVETIQALREDLGPVWGHTAVLCMTEFGRTARENGSKGTDHGTGGAMLFAGGALRGGRVVGDWPGLGDGDLYAGRDLMPTRDVRAHAAWVMRGLFGLGRDVLDGAVFPRLDLGSDPGLVL